jgi:hypothetical protein
VGQSKRGVLSINSGSSSIRFALYQIGEPMERILAGKIDRIGLSGTNLTFSEACHGQQVSLEVKIPAHSSAASFLIEWLEQEMGLAHVSAVGHRVVHGMKHTEPERVSPALLDELRGISAYDPEHLPGEIELIEAFRQRYPQLPQVACFDTAFHQTLPRTARLLPVPRRFDAMGGPALRVSWFVLYLPHASARTGCWSASGSGPRDSGASRERCEPCRDSRWSGYRHQYGLYPGWRFGDGRPVRRSGPRRGLVHDTEGASDVEVI